MSWLIATSLFLASPPPARCARARRRCRRRCLRGSHRGPPQRAAGRAASLRAVGGDQLHADVQHARARTGRRHRTRARPVVEAGRALDRRTGLLQEGDELGDRRLAGRSLTRSRAVHPPGEPLDRDPAHHGLRMARSTAIHLEFRSAAAVRSPPTTRTSGPLEPRCSATTPRCLQPLIRAVQAVFWRNEIPRHRSCRRGRSCCGSPHGS